MMKYIDLNRIKLNHLFISKFFQWQNQQNKRTLLLLVIRISNYSSGRNFFLERTIVYTSEKNGSDENGDGSEIKPFQTPLQVFIKRNFPIKFLFI